MLWSSSSLETLGALPAYPCPEAKMQTKYLKHVVVFFHSLMIDLTSTDRCWQGSCVRTISEWGRRLRVYIGLSAC